MNGKNILFLLLINSCLLFAVDSESPTQLRMRKVKRPKEKELARLMQKKDESCCLSCCYTTGKCCDSIVQWGYYHQGCVAILLGSCVAGFAIGHTELSRWLHED